MRSTADVSAAGRTRLFHVIDRRALLIATASIAAFAAAPPLASAARFPSRTIRTDAAFASAAPIFAHNGFNIEIEHSETDGSLLPRDDTEIVFGTLDALADHHPGFAYFAGLPGRLGMPDTERWIATDAAELWRDLQKQSGMMCLVAGMTRHGADLWSSQEITTIHDLRSLTPPAAGLTAAVLTGLGVNRKNGSTPRQPADLRAGFARPRGYSYCARGGIAEHGRTLALVMRRAAWERLSAGQRRDLAVAARSAACTTQHQIAAPAVYYYSLPPDLLSARDRVAEALLADVAGFDPLTGRINAAYFVARFLMA
jgi:hypothetical protein